MNGEAMKEGKSCGFTLIEVVVTLTVLAAAGTAAAMAISSAKAKIFSSRSTMEHVNAAQSCMDRIAGEYEAKRMRDGRVPDIDTVVKNAGIIGFCLPGDMDCEGENSVSVEKKVIRLPEEGSSLSQVRYSHVTVKSGPVELYHVFQ